MYDSCMTAGLEIVTDTVTGGTNISSLAAKKFWFSHHNGDYILYVDNQ